MFKKLNLKVLLALLVILGAIFAISEFTGDKERSFSRVLVAVDTAKVEQVRIQMPEGESEIILNRTGESDWQVTAEDNTYPADQSVVRSILAQFAEIRPERIAATSKDRWEEYEVSESTAIRVKLNSGNRNLADVYFGKFSFSKPPQAQQQMQQQMQQQQQGTMTSFVRKAGEDQVYAVEGFLRTTYQSDVNSYRNKKLVNIKKNDVSRLVFDYTDFQFTVEKADNRWMINNQPADSLKTERYLSRLARLSSSGFVSTSTPKTSDATHKLRIEGNNFNPIELRAFPTTDTTINHVVTSSMNPGAEFDGSKAQLFERTFVDETGFLPEEE